jgi:hypothetical protein
MVATVTVITAVGAYLLYQSVPDMTAGTTAGTWKNRGERTLQMARECTTTLDAADESRNAQERLLDAIENALRLAKFERINVARPDKQATICEAWIDNFQPNNLETSLKQLDAVLNKLAAKVDGVLILLAKRMEDGASYKNCQMFQELKQRKSLLSQQLVLIMERTDTMRLSYYRFLRYHETEETRLMHKAKVYKEILDVADESRKSQERLLADIEEALMRAPFDNYYQTKITKENWITHLPRDLGSTLADLDTRMYNLVVMVNGVLDGVLISGVEDGPDSAHVLFKELKERKKLLSKQLVQAMERIDALSEYFQHQR